MCEFCLKHGEGKRWYLQAKNYSDDLLSDVRRRRLVEQFLGNNQELREGVEKVRQLAAAPRFIRGLVRRLVVRKMKKVHYGQVVPIEEVEAIFGFVGSIVRVACVCRQATLGQEKRYCYGVSLSPNGGLLAEILRGLPQGLFGGVVAAGLETVSREDALAAFRDHEREGLCHTVWTFGSPFIGGVCNCDRSDCLAMRCTVTHGVPVMFRAEFVAAVSPDACVGCRECMRACQFGALSFSAGSRKAVVDPHYCYGCGVCRAACKKDAIRLLDRRESPVAARLW